MIYVEAMQLGRVNNTHLTNICVNMRYFDTLQCVISIQYAIFTFGIEIALYMVCSESYKITILEVYMNELALFNSLFDDDGTAFPRIWNTHTLSVPKVDVKETKDNYTLLMDLPGRSEGDVELNLKDNVLTISSSKEENKENKNNDGYLIRERSYSSFKRQFTLPDDVKGDDVNATFKNGVLEVTMPRNKAVSESRRIAITSN